MKIIARLKENTFKCDRIIYSVYLKREKNRNEHTHIASIMLNRLPVEILHNLFDYFCVHELFLSFSNVNNYIFTCLLSYSSYRFIQKPSVAVDFIYQNLQPSQIISLTSPSIFFSYFSIEQLTRLRHLKLEKCSIKQFKQILRHITQVKSLSISLNKHLPNVSFSNSLIRLTLEIKRNHTSMTEIHCFLRKLLHLKHFVLKTNGREEFLDGNRWQTSTKSLLTFNFKFTDMHLRSHHSLDSFRTTFWLKDKQWFIAYRNHCLFTIPYFAPEEINLSKFSRIRSTTSYHNTYLIYDYVRKLIVKSRPIQYRYYFPRITTLELHRYVSLETLSSLMNLNQIKHLSLLSLKDLIFYTPLDCIMCRLDELSVKNEITMDMINQIKHLQFKQILKLHIKINNIDRNDLQDRLYRLFPSLQSIEYQSTNEFKSKKRRSKRKTFYFQHGFRCYYLFNAFIIILFLICSVNTFDIHNFNSYIIKALFYTFLLTIFCKLVDIFQKYHLFTLFLKEL